MTRLGSFVRKNERSGRRAAQRAIDALVRPDTVPAAAMARLERRATAAGATPRLIDATRHVGKLDGVRHQVAMLRLLHRTGSGDLTARTPLLNKLPPGFDDAMMWDVLQLSGFEVETVRDNPDADLVAFLQPEIRRGFQADGFSPVFEWLLTTGRVGGDAAILRELLETLVSSSIERRSNAERATRPFDVDTLFAIADDLITADNPHEIHLSGAALLAAHRGEVAPNGYGGIEFASTAPLDTVVPGLGSQFSLLRRHDGHVIVRHASTGVDATIVHLTTTDERWHHSDGRFRRWYTPYDVVAHEESGRRFFGPNDVERYLDERFGDWRRPAFFYDALVDAPNTTIERTLDGLLFVHERVRTTFAAGTRHYADEWAAIMRDRFGIDYSNFVPHGAPREILATPVTSAEINGRRVRVAVASFDTIDADLVDWIEAQRAHDVFLVAGVTGHRSDDQAIERLALANSLDAVDHATLLESPNDLDIAIGGVAVDEVVEHSRDTAVAWP